jgi:streptogramin lyase
MTPAGATTAFPVDGMVNDIATGPDGNIWFILDNYRIGRITLAGVVTTFAVPGPSYCPDCGPGLNSITAGPDGNVWFAGNAIGRINPTTGAIQQFEGNRQGGNDITTGPDGNLWFTTNDAGIGRITPTGVETLFTVPGANPGETGATNGITTGPDDRLWFTMQSSNKIGALDPATGALSLYQVPTTGSQPLNITTGPDGNLWFTENQANRIGRITTTGVFTEVHVPTPLQFPNDIVAGPDHKVWFTEAQQVASLDPTSLQAPPAPCLTVTQTTKLTHDVGPCAGDGILLKGSGITLDLNGHRVLGANRHLGDFAGIHFLGATNDVVMGGEVTGFDAGVFFDFGSTNTIRAMNIHDNVGMADPTSAMGDGVFVAHSGGNKILQNVIRHNGIYDNVSLLGVDSNNNKIRNNDIEDGFDPGGDVDQIIPGLGSGIIINPFLEYENPRRGESLNHNNVIANVVSNNNGAGISNVGNDDGLVENNTVDHNGFLADGSLSTSSGDGIGVRTLNRASLATHTQVLSNTVRSNAQAGIDIESQANRIAYNTSTGNGLDDLFDANPDCDANVWLANHWSGAINPPCTGNGGSPVPEPPSTAAAPRTQSAQMAPTAPARAGLKYLGRGRPVSQP